MGGMAELILVLAVSCCLLGMGFIVGGLAERRHYRSIRRREEELRSVMVFAVRTPPRQFMPCSSRLVCGSAVIGMDYFKRFLASLRNLVGGRFGSYETMYDRARREAVLRMKAEARELNASCVLNVKFSTANILSGNAENKGSGCVEVIAYGTALIPEPGA